MAVEWRELTLEEAMSAVIDYRGKTPRKVSSGIPLITAKVVKGGRLATPDEFIAQDDYDAWMRRGLPEPGDVVLTTEAPLGEVAQLGNERIALAQRLICLRGKPDILDNDFLKFLMQSEDVQQQLRSRASGTTVLGIKQSELRQIVLTLPSFDEQRAIAHILGTLDDKIELNRRMSATLEAMARALFKSWFVDFDPVRTKAEGRDPGLPKPLADLFPARLRDSELGELPEGWQVGNIDSLCESITSGGTPARMNSAYWEAGSVPWFKTGELLDGPLLDSEEHITEAALANSSCKLWPAGTVLFALYASPTVGRLGVLTIPGTSNQAAAGLIAKPRYGVSFLRGTLIHARAELQSIAVGAAQQNINQSVLKAHRVVVPPSDLAVAYSRLMSSLHAQQTTMAGQTKTLAALRDTLLPKLMSGALRVKGAEQSGARVEA